MADDSNKNRPIVQGYSVENVLRLLEPLKSSAGGNVIYRHVAHALHEFERTQNKVSRGYAAVLVNLINAIRQHLPPHALLNLELKMVQKRLIPPITMTELAALQTYLEKVIQLTGEVSQLDHDQIRAAFAPFIDDDEESLPGPEPDDRSHRESFEQEYSATADHYARHEDASGAETLNEQQSNMMSRILDAMQHQARFGLLLEDMMHQLQKAHSQEALSHVREHAIKEIRHMLSEQSGLVRMLNETQNFATSMSEDNQRLSQELRQFRVLSLTDELTELPNRRAFTHRLGDEIARAKRYSNSLTVAMIDLDYFKDINDTYGHSVGDEMLRLYAREVLTILRRPDMVARYGGEEFAVIFPNTDLEDAYQALLKVQARARHTELRLESTVVRAPSFSAGLAAYQTNDTVDILINRVDDLLYQAKKNGRNRIETAMPAARFDVPTERENQT
jgi:diguanylate cyclase (GGDEF)-like protein